MTAGPAYASIGELATGGMGVVHLAVRREHSFERVYALKRLHRHLREDEGFRTMFMDEARIAGLIRHPAVVSVLDVGEDAEGPYLVMDLVQGVSAGELLTRAAARQIRVPVQIALRIAEQVARGLHAAHELRGHDGVPLGLVHRDVSPQNVLIAFDGTVRVTDFGVAKALGRSTRTATGVIKGKLGYLPPERLRYEEPDRRADIYALGVVLFELLAARRLYGRGDEDVRRALEQPPPDIGEEREDVDDELVELLFSTLAKDPADRPATAKELADTLDAQIADLAANEGRMDVGPWVSALFDDERRALDARIQQGIEAHAEAERAARAQRSTVGRLARSHLGWAAALVLFAAGAGAGGYGIAARTAALEPEDPTARDDVTSAATPGVALVDAITPARPTEPAPGRDEVGDEPVDEALERNGPRASSPARPPSARRPRRRGARTTEAGPRPIPEQPAATPSRPAESPPRETPAAEASPAAPASPPMWDWQP